LRPSPPRRRPTRRPRRTPLRPQDPHPPPPRRLGRHLAPSSTKQYRRSARAGSRVHLILRAKRMPAPLGNRPFAGAPPLRALRPLLDTIFPFRQDAVGRWQRWVFNTTQQGCLSAGPPIQVFVIREGDASWENRI